MSTSTDPKVDPLARLISLGNAPATQTGAGGQWVNAWSVTGVTAVERADATNAAEAWTALKYTDLLATTLAGGDIYRGDLGVSGQTSATSTVKQEIDGKEALRFNLAEAALSTTISLSSFYANDDGSAYAEGARVRLFDASGNLVGETFVRADSLDGNKTVQIVSNAAFRAVEISAGAQKADGSFSFGGYSNSDGSFGADSYTSGSKHGSDFLLHAISFALARPTAAADSYTLNQDAPAASFASVLANDQDANGAALSAVLDGGASHGTLTLNADGSFTYQPAAHYVGEDTFTYRASNGKDLSDVTVVHLTVNAVNHAPAAVDDHVSTDERTVVTGNVLNGASGGLDTDSDADVLSVSSAGSFVTTLGAKVTLNANGDFSYDPTASVALQALGAGDIRVDGFDYSIADGHGGVATAHVDVAVSGVPDTGGDNGGGQVPVPADTPLSYYMRYTSAGGTSAWMKIDGMSTSVTAEASGLKGTGATVGKPAPDAVTLEMGTGKALTEFTSNLLKGTAISNIEIEAYAGNGPNAQPVQEYRYTSNFVTSALSSAGADGATTNSVSFVYKTVDQTIAQLGVDGKPLQPLDLQWNVSEMRIGTLTGSERVDAGADADLAHLAPVVDSTAPLDYYVHIDGINGWVSLSSFALGYSAETSWTKGAGAAVGMAEPQGLSLGLGPSQALLKLMSNELFGTSARNIQVEAYSRDPLTGAAVLADEYIFNNVYTTKVNDASGADSTVDLVYKTFSHAHLAYDASGKLDNAASSSVGYDFAKAVVISAPDAVAEANDAAPAPSVPADTPLSYYMRYTSAGGTSAWMKIDGMSTSVTAEASGLKGTGATVGKPTPDAVTLEMGTGKALTEFTSNLLKGTAISNIEIEAYAGNGPNAQPVQEYRYTSNFVTSALSSAGADGATTNSVSFVYKTVDQTIAQLGVDGKPLQPLDLQWNVSEMRIGGLTGSERVDAGADADLAHLAPVVDSTAPLDYYVHIDGINGWVSLSSFALGYSAETSWTKGAGAAVGMAEPQGLSLGLGPSQALLKLMSNELFGTSARNIQVEAYSRDPLTGAAVLADEYIFNNVYTTKVNDASGADSTVDLVYKTFSHAHLAYDASGKLDNAASSSVGYDFAKAVVISAPGAVAEANDAAPAPSVPADTPLSYYMRYTSAGGTSAWMKIDGMSTSVTAEASGLKGTGATVGKPTPDAVTLEMGTGKALTEFTSNLLKGTAISNIEIEAYAGNGPNAQPVQEYRYTSNFVTSALSSAGADGATTNSVSFVYKTVDQTIAQLGVDGKPLQPLDLQWNVSEMRIGTLTGSERVDAGADADLAHLAPVVDSTAPLDYYVHIDGINGWVSLSSFALGYSAETSWTKGAGAAVGMAEPQGLSLGLGPSQALLKLMSNELFGTSARNIQVEAYSRDPLTGAAVLADEYIFDSVYTTKVNDASGADSTVDLVYKTFSHAHLAYDASGKLDNAASSSVGYDFAKAVVIGAPTPHADAIV